MNNELIDLIVKVVFAVASVLITGYLIPWLKNRLSAEKYAELLVFIEKCVEAAEKIYTTEEWKAKKEYVLEMAENKLDSLGIDVSSEELNGLIEGLVYSVKG